ncbi:MAG: aminoglycoside phosphotransferase family protein [Pseudonocardiaceae bacterium]
MTAPAPSRTPTIATAVRPSWDEMPPALRDGLADRLGPITSAQTQTGGFTPGLAVRLRLASGERLFTKGIPADHVLADKYRAEAATARQLPETTPTPRLHWNADIAGWVVLAFDDIDGRHPRLGPGSPDVGAVVTTIAHLADVLSPCPVADAPPATVELADLVHGWSELATAPPADLDDWTRRHLDDLAALETCWLGAAEGTTLLHGDINQSNLLIDGAGKVALIDWAQPVCGAAWIDVADLVPHLIVAGHSPASAEQALADIPTWRDTDPAMITSYATAFAGYWARNSRRPAPPGVPHLRAHQARAASAATTWVAHRTKWW